MDAVSEISEEDVPGFVLTDVKPDQPLCEKIKDGSGLDIRGGTGNSEERLKQDQQDIQQKLEEIANRQEQQENNIAVDTVWTEPAPDTSAGPGTDAGASGGSDSSDDSDGSGGSGEEPPGEDPGEVVPPTDTVRLTMPVEDNVVDNCLRQADVRQVTLLPGAARASTANMLEVDSGVTVPGGKTLTLEAGVGMTVLSGRSAAVEDGGGS